MKYTLKKLNKMMENNFGGLDLSNTKITELPEGLIVGGWLNLRNTKITELPEGLIVGGWLDLSDTKITELPEDLKVGGNLYHPKLELSDSQKLKNGTYVEGKYLYCDNILTHIKTTKQVHGYTYYIGKIKDRNVIFDGENYAHCKTFKEGVLDLEFKKLKDRGAEQYSHLTLGSVISKYEAINMYRVLTGACKQGTMQFVDSIKDIKDEYAIREIIELTNGNYGSSVFKKFFKD